VAQLGDYEVDGLVGRGAVGIVYRARHRGNDEVLALKVVPWAGDENVVDRLRRESAAIRSLGHPYILEVLGLVRDQAGLVVAMSLANGGSLADALAGRGAMPPDEAAALGAKVADALAAVHALGILHADVKPSNILLDDEGEPLLSDFGLSWHTAVLSQGGAGVAGTAEYLDPQVTRGESPSAASDIYSLGVVYYEMLAGRPPYRGLPRWPRSGSPTAAGRSRSPRPRPPCRSVWLMSSSGRCRDDPSSDRRRRSSSVMPYAPRSPAAATRRHQQAEPYRSGGHRPRTRAVQSGRGPFDRGARPAIAVCSCNRPLGARGCRSSP
jgi:serine/threonine protein kinase